MPLDTAVIAALTDSALIRLFVKEEPKSNFVTECPHGPKFQPERSSFPRLSRAFK